MTSTLSDAAILASLVDYARHNSAYPQFNSLIGAHQYQPLYRLCAQYLSSGATVLDWGCGNGHFSYYLIHKGYKTHGFAFEDFPLLPDLIGQGFQFQRGKLGEPVQLPYADQQFDAVASIGVLEHVREFGGDDLASLREIHRVLKPQGLFICYHLPNRYSLIEWLAAKLPGKYHHPYKYTRADIEALCGAAFFNLVEVQRYGLLPRNMMGNWEEAGKSPFLTHGWNICDRALGKVLSAICQNYYFIAQKNS